MAVLAGESKHQHRTFPAGGVAVVRLDASLASIVCAPLAHGAGALLAAVGVRCGGQRLTRWLHDGDEQLVCECLLGICRAFNIPLRAALVPANSPAPGGGGAEAVGAPCALNAWISAGSDTHADSKLGRGGTCWIAFAHYPRPCATLAPPDPAISCACAMPRERAARALPGRRGPLTAIADGGGGQAGLRGMSHSTRYQVHPLGPPSTR